MTSRTQADYGKTAKMAALWDFGTRVSGQAILFVVSLFLARLLTPADFGVTAAAQFLVVLSSYLTQLGLNAALVRMKEVRSEHASSVFVTNLVVGIVAFLGLWSASPLVGRFFDSPDVAKVLPVAAVVFLITPFGSVASAMMLRNLQYRASILIGSCSHVGGAFVTLILAWFGFGYWSLVVGAVSGAVISTAGFAWLSPWRFSLRLSKAALRDTLSFGIGFQAKQCLVFSTTNLDNMVVGRLLGVISLGFYDKAYGLMNGLTERMTFDGALMRIFALLREEPSRFRRALMKGVQATSLVIFPLLTFSAVTADRLVVALFGPQWTPSVGPFQVLAIVGMLRAMNRPVSAANESLGLVWLQAGLQGIDVLLLVVGVAVGARWGLTGASMGVLVASAANSLLSMRLLARHTTVTLDDLWSSFWPPLATAAAMAAVVVAANGLMRYLEVSRVSMLLVGDFMAAAVAYPVLLLFSPFESVRTVVRETVDDLAPWLRRYMRCGALRQHVVASDTLVSMTTKS